MPNIKIQTNTKPDRLNTKRRSYISSLGYWILVGIWCSGLGMLLVVPTNAANSLIINEVQITGGTGLTTHDFVELYNPTSSPVNLNGHRLVKRTKTGTSDTTLKSWSADESIPAKGFYLWASSKDPEWPTSVGAGASTSQVISGDNGVALRQGDEDTGTIIDSVAWGDAVNAFIEGTAYPDDPGASESIERINFQDTNSNNTDFVLRTTPTPTHTPTVTEPEPGQTSEGAEDEEKESTTENQGSGRGSSGGTIPDQPLLLLNEILPNPRGSDRSEFIEIRNPRGSAFELKGWNITNKRGQSYTFEYRTIPSFGIIRLDRATTGLILQNDEERVSLFAPYSTTAHVSVSITDAPEGQSLMYDNTSWAWTTLPTPGSKNIFAETPDSPVLVSFVPEEGRVGEILFFDASDSYDPEGDPLMITWDFGDGVGTSEEIDAIYIYTVPGTFLITLSAINPQGMLTKEESKIVITKALDHSNTKAQNITKVGEQIKIQDETKTPKDDKTKVDAATPKDAPANKTSAASGGVNPSKSSEQNLIEGVVTVPPGILGTTFGYIDCLSPCTGQGIKIRMTKAAWPELQKGDVIRMSGSWSQSGGEDSFLTRVEYLTQTNRQQRITATPATISTLSDTLLNKLIEVAGEVTDKSGTRIYLDDGTDEIEVEIKNAAHRRMIAEGDEARIAGVLTKKEDGALRLRGTEEPFITNALPRDQVSEVVIARDPGNERSKYLAIAFAAMIAIIARPLFLFIQGRRKRSSEEVL